MTGFGHERCREGATNEWLTPPEILASLGQFDLDPCSPVNRPWDTAKRHYTINDDGLSQPWQGRIWLNPPYGPHTGKWLSRLADHGNGIALIFARTDTAMFHQWGWGRADGMLFLRGRVHFCDSIGQRSGNPGAPSVLIAYGDHNVDALESSCHPGHLIRLAHSSSIRRAA